MGWPEAMAIFTQGKAAFYTEADSLYKNATDPAKSKVTDTGRLRAVPGGPRRVEAVQHPVVGAWASTRPPSNKANAWKFIEWATSKEQTLAAAEGRRPGARASVWADPEGTSTFPKDLVAAIEASAKDGVGHDRPRGRQGCQGPRDRRRADRATRSPARTPSAAADTANTAFQKFLDDEAK